MCPVVGTAKAQEAEADLQSGLLPEEQLSANTEPLDTHSLIPDNLKQLHISAAEKKGMINMP